MLLTFYTIFIEENRNIRYVSENIIKGTSSMDDFEAYVNSDRFSGSSAWRSRLGKKKIEGLSDNGTYQDVAVSVLREERKPNSGLTDEAMQAIEAKHRFVFST